MVAPPFGQVGQEAGCEPPAAVVLAAAMAWRHRQLGEVQLFDEPEGALVVAELEEVDLEAHFARGELAQTVHQGLGGDLVALHQLEEHTGLPGWLAEPLLEFGDDGAAGEQQRSRKVGRLEVVDDLVERAVAIGGRDPGTGLERESVIAGFAGQDEGPL